MLTGSSPIVMRTLLLTRIRADSAQGNAQDVAFHGRARDLERGVWRMQHLFFFLLRRRDFRDVHTSTVAAAIDFEENVAVARLQEGHGDIFVF